MSQPHVLQLTPFPEWDQAALEAAYILHRYDQAADKQVFLARHGADARAIITRGSFGASAEIIAACPQLEVICVYGVGYDAVAVGACRTRGIRVTNTPDVLTGDVADLGVAMMLALARNLVGAEAWVRQGHWTGGAYPLGRRVFGQKAGVLGLGRIGQAVARRLQGFDMDIAYSDIAPVAGASAWRYLPDPVALSQQSDVLFVTLAASDATRHIVGRTVIEALGPEGMVINISRAANVDETALLDALEAGRLRGAALDVFEGEPHLNPRFLALDNVLLQPHHASATVETRREMGQLMRDNLAAHFQGHALLTPIPDCP